MTGHLRALVGIAAGFIVSVVIAYLAAIVVVLLTIGIPLGSEGRPPTAGEYSILLVLAGVAAAIGGRTTARIAPGSSVPVPALSVLLAVFLLWGFSGHNAWPPWWGPAIAAAMAAGAWLGGRGRRRRP